MAATTATSTIDIAYLRLREQIVNAELMPGAFTIEYELATQLHVEASDIRDAARRLEQEGFVKTSPLGGFTIAPISVEQIESLSRQISTLEARAAYIAAVKGPTPIGLSALSDAVVTMEDALYRSDARRWAGAAHHFHRSLVQCSARPRLIAAALALSEQIHRNRMIAVNLAGPPSNSAEASRQLVEAIRSGAPTEAYDLHVQWWHETTETFIGLVRKNGIHQMAAA